MAHAAWKWMALVAVLGGGVFAACSDDDDGGGPNGNTDAGTDVLGENKFRPGLGDDEGSPVGTPLSLPPGIQVSGQILGVNADPPGECEGNKSAPAGSGRAVLACLKVTNTTGGPVTLDLNEGLILISEFQDGQNGLLVERVRVTVPPTGGGTGGIDAGTDGGTGEENVFVIPLRMYCLNESRSPSFDGMTYELGVVTSDPDLRELLSLLAGKRIDTDAKKSVVQTAIYNITEGRGLTRADRDAIARL